MRLGSRRFNRFSLLVDPEPARQVQPTLVTDAFCTASFNIVLLTLRFYRPFCWSMLGSTFIGIFLFSFDQGTSAVIA
jgi:hypothetical protein